MAQRLRELLLHMQAAAVSGLQKDDPD